MVIVRDLHDVEVTINISMSSTVEALFTAVYAATSKALPFDELTLVWAGRDLSDEDYQKCTLAEQNIVPNSKLFALWIETDEKSHLGTEVFPRVTMSSQAKSLDEKTEQQREEDAPNFNDDE